MKIFILRHGRTELNSKGIFNGQVDEPLNDEGREQAARAHDRLAEILEEQGINLSGVFCSPLSRAWETCEIATAGLSAPVTLEPRLMERSMGPLDGRDLGMSGFDPTDLFSFNYDPALPGFETWSLFFERVQGFISELLEKYSDTDQNFLLVTHGGTIRAIYYYFFQMPADGNFEEPKLKNCDICELDIKKGSQNATYRLLTQP